jgi:hypothetical protein
MPTNKLSTRDQNDGGHSKWSMTDKYAVSAPCSRTRISISEAFSTAPCKLYLATGTGTERGGKIVQENEI